MVATVARSQVVNLGAAERQFGLDVMRATAALVVVLAHGMIYAAATIPALVLPGVILATVGVEIFFVLSGFLIAPGLFAVTEGRMTASRFWLRRAWRTLPSYYIFLAINLLIVAWFAHDRVPHISYGFFSQSLITPPTSVFFAESWSLAVEEWFYLSAAVAALLSFRFGGKTGAQFRLWLWLLVVLSPVMRAAWCVMQGYPWDSGLRKLTLFRLDAIAIGVLMAARVRDGISLAVACVRSLSSTSPTWLAPPDIWHRPPGLQRPSRGRWRCRLLAWERPYCSPLRRCCNVRNRRN